MSLTEYILPSLLARVTPNTRSRIVEMNQELCVSALCLLSAMVALLLSIKL